MIHPGNLAEGAQVKHDSDQYLFDIIKNGGAPIGRPGMPAFGSQLTDEDMHALVAYVRSLGIARDAPLR
jgi:mono/diheme cytochrome c family protein